MGTVTMHRWTVSIVVTLSSFSYLVTCLPGKYYLVETYDDDKGGKPKFSDYMDDVEEENYKRKRLNTYKKPEPAKEYERGEKYTTAEPQIEPYEEEPEAQLDAGYKEDEEYEEEALEKEEYKKTQYKNKEEEEYDQNEGFEEGRRKRNRRRRRNRSRRM